MWYDGYDGEHAALFDDFDGDMSFRTMLNICDGYPLQVQVKGAFVRWAPRMVIFTTDCHPRAWAFDCGSDGKRQALNEERWSQLARRISLIEKVEGPPLPLVVLPNGGLGGGNTNPPPTPGFSNIHRPPAPPPAHPLTLLSNEEFNALADSVPVLESIDDDVDFPRYF